jgi:hypothetical protein
MIRQVPCILVFFSNGVVNKYEGDKAFQWVDETILKMKNVMSSMMPSSPPPPFHMEQQSQRAFSKLPVERVEVEPISVESSEHNSSSSVDMRRRIDSAPLLRKTEEPTKTESEATQNTTTDQNPRGIKSDKQESLLTLAQQMQKERDIEE